MINENDPYRRAPGIMERTLSCIQTPGLTEPLIQGLFANAFREIENEHQEIKYIEVHYYNLLIFHFDATGTVVPDNAPADAKRLVMKKAHKSKSKRLKNVA